MIYSLVRSARRHDLDPWVYLREVLDRIRSTPLEEVSSLAPDRWKAEELQPGGGLLVD